MKSNPVKYQISSGGVIYRPSPEGLQIALIRRSSQQGKDIWCLPKGWVEPGESLEETAAREVSEETGLEGRIILKLGIITYGFYEKEERQQIHKTVHFFLMEFTGGDTARHDDEVLEARWFKPEEVDKRLVFPGERDIFKKAQRALTKREKLNGSARLLSLFMALALLLSGCVTQATHDALRAQYLEADARIDQLNKRIENLQGELDRSRKSLDEAKGKLSSIQSSRKIQKSDLDLLSEKNVSLSEETEILRRRNRDLTDTIESQKARVENLAAQVEALEFLSKTLSKQVEEFKSNAAEVEKARAKTAQLLRKVENKLRGPLREGLSAGGILITVGPDRIEIRLSQSAIFDSGGLEIKPAGGEILKNIAQVVKEYPAMTLEVKGHTDNVPIAPRSADRFPSNWELSTARASRVARFLESDAGIESTALSAAGFADSKPVAENDTVAGRALNRRIEISLIPVEEFPTTGSVSSKPDGGVSP